MKINKDLRPGTEDHSSLLHKSWLQLIADFQEDFHLCFQVWSPHQVWLHFPIQVVKVQEH